MITKTAAKENILQLGNWYHTYNIMGLETPGVYDYKNIIKKISWPNMEGRSVVDVGCSDGFFSTFFALNLRARKVIGIDTNQYDGTVPLSVLRNREADYHLKYSQNNDFEDLQESYERFDLKNSNKFLFIKKVLEIEQMEFQSASIYDLSKLPNGDIVFCGSLLEHLRDPISAIENLYSITNETCIIDVSNVLRYRWNLFRGPLLRYNSGGGSFYDLSAEAVKAIMRSVGFQVVEILDSYHILNKKKGYKVKNVILIGKK